MRILITGLAALLTGAFAWAGGGAGKVEIKGPHVCCKQCVNIVGKILAKVDGVSEVQSDIATRTITFTAKDAGAAKAGFKALLDGGFFGSATHGGKEVKVDVASANGKADSVTVKDVHVCCTQCVNAVKKALPGADVKFEGKGPQKDVRVEGKNLDAGDILEALRKAGFNGSVAK